MFKNYLLTLICALALGTLTACSSSDDSSSLVEDGSSEAALGLDSDGSLTLGDPNANNNGFNGGAFANAREDYNKKMSAPVYANANGRDTLFYEHVATIPEDMVDDMFFGLLQEHRSKQAELNGLLSKVERELTEDRLRVNAEYAKKCKDYLNEEKEVRAQFDEYLEKERKRIADLKIVLPNRFKAISEKIESLGKRKKK